MQHSGDQTKIHLNPDFLSRGRAKVNPKVHVNPAFLLKSQESLATQSYVTSASIPTTGHAQHWQGLASGTTRHTTSHVKAGLPHTSTHIKYSQSSKSVLSVPAAKTYNTELSNLYTVPSGSNTVTCDPYTKSNSVAHSSSNAKSHNLYSKNNKYNPYSKTSSVYTKGQVQTPQNFVTRDLAFGKHSSSYSWKASNTKTWTAFKQSDSSTSVDTHVKASVVKQPQIATQQYTHLNPAAKYPSVNKTFISTSVTGTVSQKATNCHESKFPASHVSPPSISYTVKNIPHSGTCPVEIKGNINSIKPSPPKPLAGKCGKDAETKAQVRQSAGQTNSGKAAINKNVTYKSEGLTAQGSRPGTAMKAAQLTPNQKWMNKTKLVNSSHKKTSQAGATHLSNSNNQVALKTPKQKGNYKIITKTKLVRTNSKSTTKSKVQQQAGLEVQSAAHSSKAMHPTSPQVTYTTRASKQSPALRAHHTGTKSHSKRKYSVLSNTKLVRNQNLFGKAATPGKPKYSVITKNKLVRRRSNSGSGLKILSKASEPKTKANKPETDRQRKFHVLSKTKIVRRRSNSGVYKVISSPVIKVTTPAYLRKRVIIKRHKLIRNAPQNPSSASAKDTPKGNRRLPKKLNTAYRVINATKISPKQRVAKGIISKYKINRLKVDSFSSSRRHHYFDYSTKARQRNKYKFQSKEVCTSKKSDRFINIGGILYKSTKTSLRKQLPKTNLKASLKKPSKPFRKNMTCTVLLRGEKFRLTAGRRTLQRIVPSPAATSTPARVHLGGLTYTRTRTGHYELTKTHQARALLSSARQRSVVTLTQKKRKAVYQKRNEYCVFFNRFGRCTKKDRGQCPYVHDPNKVAICTRFLRGRCPVNNCPFSHTIDPDKMPVCSHFLQAACTREDCPYRHVKVNPSAPVCLGFIRGHCKAGEECDKQHILVCEENKDGKCPRGASCPLSHHKGKKRRKRVSFSRDSERRTSFVVYRKRKRSESLEVLGGPVTKKRVEKRGRELESKSSQQRYFHLLAAEGSPCRDADAQETSQFSDNGEQKVPEEKISGVRTINLDADDVFTEAKDQGLETQRGKVIETDQSKKSLLEETRSRVMKKVDQMKKSHLAFFSDVTEDTAVTYMGLTEARDTNQASTAAKENPSKSNIAMTESSSEASTPPFPDAETLTNTDETRVQRPPLPKRLPSYIPLTLDED